MLYLLLLMPSSGVKPLCYFQTAYFGQLWARFSREQFWAPLRYLHICNQGNFSFSTMCNSIIFEYAEILGQLFMSICFHSLRPPPPKKQAESSGDQF